MSNSFRIQNEFLSQKRKLTTLELNLGVYAKFPDFLPNILVYQASTPFSLTALDCDPNDKFRLDIDDGGFGMIVTLLKKELGIYEQMCTCRGNDVRIYYQILANGQNIAYGAPFKNYMSIVSNGNPQTLLLDQYSFCKTDQALFVQDVQYFLNSNNSEVTSSSTNSIRTYEGSLATLLEAYVRPINLVDPEVYEITQYCNEGNFQLLGKISVKFWPPKRALEWTSDAPESFNLNVASGQVASLTIDGLITMDASVQIYNLKHRVVYAGTHETVPFFFPVYDDGTFMLERIVLMTGEINMKFLGDEYTGNEDRNLELLIIDPYNQYVRKPLIIHPCHPSCDTCSGFSQYECTTCASGLIRQYNSDDQGYCIAPKVCDSVSYIDEDGECQPCSSACSTTDGCNGPSFYTVQDLDFESDDPISIGCISCAEGYGEFLVSGKAGCFPVIVDNNRYELQPEQSGYFWISLQNVPSDPRYSYKSNPSWARIYSIPIPFGIYVGVDVPSSSYGDYSFIVGSGQGVFTSFFKMTLSVSASYTDNILFKEQVPMIQIGFGPYPFPQDYLCSNMVQDVIPSYKEQDTIVTSTDSTADYFLTYSEDSPPIPLLNVNNEVGSGLAQFQIICTSGPVTITQVVILVLKDNNPPAFNPQTPIPQTIFFLDKSFSIQLAGILSDYNVPDREQITDFKAYLSTDPLDYTKTPSYIDQRFVNFMQNYSLNFSFSYTQGSIGTNTLYLTVLDTHSESSTVEFQLTVSGCDGSCFSQISCTKSDKYGCTRCPTGKQFYYDSIGKFCMNPCPQGKYSTILGECINCENNCKLCSGPGSTLTTQQCTQCSATSFINSGSCVSVCPQGKTYLTGDNKCIVADPPVLEAGFATRLQAYQGFQISSTYSISNLQNNINYSLAYKIFSGNSSSGPFNTANDIKSQFSWVSVAQTSTNQFSLRLGYSSAIPTPTGNNQDFYYTVRLTITQTDGKSISIDVRLSHLVKIPPEITNNNLLAIGDYKVGDKISFSIKKSYFIDRRGIQFNVTCDNLVSYLSQNISGSDYSYQGTIPKSSEQQGRTFTISCQVLNLIGFSTSYAFKFTTQSNNAPVWSSGLFTDATVYMNSTFSRNFQDACVDKDGDPLTLTPSLNSGAITQTSGTQGFVYVLRSNTFAFYFNSINFIGNYTFSISCSDGIYPPQVKSFQIIAKQYQPPILIKAIPTIQTSIFDSTLTLNLQNYFQDPQGLFIQYSLIPIQAALPSFIKSFDSGLLIFYSMSERDVGVYDLQISATNAGQQSIMTTFKLTVQGCSDGCQTCTSIDQSSCTSCKQSYYLSDGKCQKACPTSTYKDDSKSICSSCPQGCSTCSLVQNSLQCSACQNGFYLFDSSCLTRCPQGYRQDGQHCTFIVASDVNGYQECTQLVSLANQQGYLTASEFKDLSSLTSEAFTCSKGPTCSSTQPEAECTWNRKFSLSCGSTADLQATIRVATNSLPNYCISQENSEPIQSQIDFQVLFDGQGGLLKYQTVKSQPIADSFRCSDSWLKSDQIISGLNYQSFISSESDDAQMIVGVSFNGVAIKQALVDIDDPIHPLQTQSKSEVTNFDECLGYNGYNDFYHYYSISPCLNQIYRDQSQGRQCDDMIECSTNFTSYLQARLTGGSSSISYKGLNVIGIARDGHLILDIYKSDGQLWQPCDVDICNGVRIDGNYYYASTYFHPYTVGCWGPATSNVYQDKCTSLNLVCPNFDGQDSMSVYYSQRLIGIIMISYIFSFFI